MTNIDSVKHLNGKLSGQESLIFCANVNSHSYYLISILYHSLFPDAICHLISIK